MNADERRRSLSQDFANIVERYQQVHRLLLDALSDDDVDTQQFELLSEQVHRNVNELKLIKMEMRRQRSEIEASKGEASRPGEG